MTYFKINGVDFSNYVSGLSITFKQNYTSDMNAGGDTMIDYINCKREIKVNIIPLNAEAMSALFNEMSVVVPISFKNPATGQLEENVSCLLQNIETSYYTIQDSKVLHNAFELKFAQM